MSRGLGGYTVVDIEYLEKLASIKNIRHLKEFDSLKLSPNDYYIGASANLIYYGYPKINDDIDINISRKAYNKIKNKLVPLPNDGIHNGHFNIPNGHLDIVVDDKIDPLGLSSQIGNTLVDGNYRFLTKPGLQTFYSNLYNKFHKDKHKKALDWLKKETSL